MHREIIHYALTVSPTIYAYYIEQFWNTAHSQTVNDVKQIHATVDFKTVVISESSVRSDLHFNDEDDTKKVFTNMKRKGKDFSRRVTPLFALMLAPPVVEGEEDTQLPQTSVLIPNVADEVVFKEWDDRVVRATTTAASLDAAQASGAKKPWSVIAQTRSERASKHSYDSPLPGGNTPGSDKERLEHDDLTDFVPPTPYDSPLLGGHTPGSDEDLVIRRLKKKVRKLEKKLRARTLGLNLFKIGTSKRKSLDKENVFKQGRKSDKTKPMFEDSDFSEIDIENVKGDAETQGRNTVEHGDTVNTASIDVSVAGPLNVSTADPSISTIGDIFKDEMVTIADTLVAIKSTRPRTTSVVIHDVEEEPRRATPIPIVQSQDKEIAQRLFEEEQAQFEREQRIAREKAAEQEAKDTSRLLVEIIAERKRFTHNQRSLEEIQMLYEKEQKWIDDFVPMDSELEVQRLKRAGEAQSTEKEKELSEEELQKLLVVVLVEEVYVEALHVKYPIIDWEVYFGDIRRYWRIIRFGNHTEAYQIFAEMLKKFDRDDLVKLWDLVKERFSTTEPTEDKEKELWVELKRLFELDNDDIIWKLQRYMHDPLVWRLYDTCGVHHVSSVRGHDIFMLVEKDYPLPKGVLMLMLVNKLLVEADSETSRELLRKIFIQANRSRQQGVWIHPPSAQDADNEET
ncbi:hypothetical protein Tco_1013084 [Tanacetum coccineum]